jgi:DNA-binding transcriptional LysR family regulator
VVSQTLANLEGQLGVKLFDRSARLPVLTDQGRTLLAHARAVAGDVDVLKARAKNWAAGLEPELSVAVDVMFPPAPLTEAVAAFQQVFPSTLLNSNPKRYSKLGGRRSCSDFSWRIGKIRNGVQLGAEVVSIRSPRRP